MRAAVQAEDLCFESLNHAGRGCEPGRTRVARPENGETCDVWTLCFCLGPGMQSTVETKIEGSVAVYKPLKGLKSATFMTDDDAGE